MTGDELHQAIGAMTYQECIAARAAIEGRVHELQTVKADELLARFEAESDALGIDMSRLLAGRYARGRRRGRRNGHAGE